MEKEINYNLTMSEADLLESVIDLAHVFGWTVAHFRPARVMKNGIETWRTPVEADGKGFPDLVLARETPNGFADIIFAELKSERGKLTIEQKMWLQLLGKNPAVRCFVWPPSNWLLGEIEKVLK